MRCAMTGQEIKDPADGIWDDGEWISWDWINQQIYEQERKVEFPKANPALIDVFDQLVEVAANYKSLTGRYLQIWGELGELYAEIKFGVKRHRPMAQGSDGKLGHDFVEVKTISPEKSGHTVHVKRAGNFSKLLVVRISDGFKFEAKMIERRAIGKGSGKHAKVSWHTMPKQSK